MNFSLITEPRILVLRTCGADMTSRNSFRWPTSGWVEAPDWDCRPRRGGGLHGLPRGEGNGLLLSWDDAAVWLVVEVEMCNAVVIKGLDGLPKHIKFRGGHVRYAGERGRAIALVQGAHAGAAVVGATKQVGDKQVAIVGDRGLAVCGDGGGAHAGVMGRAKAGRGGLAVAGREGFALSGDGGTAKVGDGGVAAAGEGGVIEIAKERGRSSKQVRRLVWQRAEVGKDVAPGVPYQLFGGRFVEVSL